MSNGERVEIIMTGEDERIVQKGERIEYHSLSNPTVVFSVERIGSSVNPRYAIYRDGEPSGIETNSLGMAIHYARMAARSVTIESGRND